jgi:hypothetical protein
MRKGTLTRICRHATVLVVALEIAAPALAGQQNQGLNLSGAVPGPWPPAESGKPSMAPLSATPAPPEGERCAPALPCGSRLIGTVRKNGGLELQVPAWHW